MKKCLFLLSLFLSIQTAWSYDVEVDDIYFNLNKADKTATVTNNNETIGMWHAYSGDMVVPECILVSGVLYTVTTLGEGCFALSNNLKYDNPLLDEWKNKYNVHYLNGDYSNCNYQKKDKSADCEVLITNY